jgi:hypothetical protein
VHYAGEFIQQLLRAFGVQVAEKDGGTVFSGQAISWEKFVSL